MIAHQTSGVKGFRFATRLTHAEILERAAHIALIDAFPAALSEIADDVQRVEDDEAECAPECR